MNLIEKQELQGTIIIILTVTFSLLCWLILGTLGAVIGFLAIFMWFMLLAFMNLYEEIKKVGGQLEYYANRV